LPYYRYLTSQEYKAHYDAFDLTSEDGRRFARNGGQRVCTVLVYLNDVAVGGKTTFPRLSLSFTPRRGAALVGVLLKEEEEEEDVHT